jgi:FkbM family methyltransferase
MGIKKVLQKILGEKRYLSLLAGSFQRIYRTGWLGKEYEDVYFLKQFVREGDWCVDIGAHLGYFTLELSRLVKSPGKVFAVEPMSKFNTVLQRLLRRYGVKNVTVYRVALGGKGEFVEMGIPEVGKMKRYACARIKESSANLQYIESEKVPNESGDHLFRDLPRLDYIKCDVEGMEFPVFASMTATLKAHHPVILCEFFDKDERIKLYELIRPLGYAVYALQAGKLHPIDVYAGGNMVSQNNYFIPAVREGQMKHLMG